MPCVVCLKTLFVGTDAVSTLLGAKRYFAKMSLNFTFKDIIVSHVLESRMLSGKLFQTEAAECLKPRDVSIQLTQNFYKLSF